MKKTGFQPRQVTLLGLLTALLILLSVTPLGYLRIGPISATLNMIPVGVAAVALGWKGGAFTGCVFGLTSFVSALTGGSAIGAILMGISPVRTFFLCMIPRVMMGFLVGVCHGPMASKLGEGGAGRITGFFCAAWNTIFYMAGLLLLFGRTEYVQSLVAGRNVLAFVCGFVGLNAVLEVVCATVLVGLLAKALERARLIGR